MSLQNTPLDGWAATGTATNALATATKAAASGKSHYLSGVVASFSAAAIALLQVKDGTTVIAETYVHNAERVDFAKPIRITKGNACSAELAAGGAGVVGKVNIKGFTEPEN